ncbi:hypothetical protein BDZ94DRAFT_1311318 [Collybia nuda]|uniref:Uncharacterized protein n=1 Tax=Collybia nuda TaxID=64659 RepID=A0A9P5Y3K5_9AGAR|nr:hypothetical protein BDZ94DRAFT_1311318 [Collybia nuda]
MAGGAISSNNKNTLASDGANSWLLEPPPHLFYGYDLLRTFTPIDLRHDQLPVVLYYTERSNSEGQSLNELLPPLLYYGYPIPQGESVTEFLLQLEERMAVEEGSLDHASVHGFNGPGLIICLGSNYEAPDQDPIKSVRKALGKDLDEPKWYLSLFDGEWKTMRSLVT